MSTSLPFLFSQYSAHTLLLPSSRGRRAARPAGRIKAHAPPTRILFAASASEARLRPENLRGLVLHPPLVYTSLSGGWAYDGASPLNSPATGAAPAPPPSAVDFWVAVE
jgi:hypothetical protein